MMDGDTVWRCWRQDQREQVYVFHPANPLWDMAYYTIRSLVRTVFLFHRAFGRMTEAVGMGRYY
jgi:hypothetical protein